MKRFLDQAEHNKKFHKCICDEFPDIFFDWKITAVFYISIHYLKALGANRRHDFGETHREIRKNVCPYEPNARYKITITAWDNYDHIQQYSRTARYEGITDPETFEQLRKNDYDDSLIRLKDFIKYIKTSGVPI